MNMLQLSIRICLSLTKITKTDKTTLVLGRNEDGSERDLCPGRSGYTGSPEQELLGYVWGFVCAYIKIKR